VLILLLYTVVGAIIFMLIEGPNEEYELEQLKRQREKLLEDTAFRLNTVKSMTPLQASPLPSPSDNPPLKKAYNHTVATLVQYRERLGVPEVDLDKTKWTIWGSIYFAMTVYTTIGYGNIVPVTTTGRILTIIYALIGLDQLISLTKNCQFCRIPLALIALIALGGLFARICLIVWRLLGRMLGCFSKKLERKVCERKGSSN
jgi:hypothetical protein